MANEWYIVQTYTGYEGKVSRVIQQKLDAGELSSDIVKSIKVPEEELVEMTSEDYLNEMVETTISQMSLEDKVAQLFMITPEALTGYIMAELDLPDLGWKETCNKIRHIQGVSGFVGTAPNERPRPISIDEAKNILMRSGEIKGERPARIKQTYAIGDTVKIIDGPFKEFSGTVDALDDEKEKLTVTVQIFGRATPVELIMTQVEKAI